MMQNSLRESGRSSALADDGAPVRPATASRGVMAESPAAGTTDGPCRSYALHGVWTPILQQLGLPMADVLRRAGLPDDLLSHPSARLDPVDFYRLWDEVVAALGSGEIASRLCDAVRTEAFSPALFAALCSPNLVMALHRLARFKPLVAPIRLDVVETGDEVTARLHWPSGDIQPPASLIHTELLLLVLLARVGTRYAVAPVRVCTAVAPPSAGAYAEFLGRPMLAGVHHEVVFARSDATRAFLTANDELWRIFEPELRTRLAMLDDSANLTERVRAALHEALPAGVVAIEPMARRLAMSPRTIQRRLAVEGTSFSAVVQDTRNALSRYYLGATTMTVAEIALLLGFDEPNSFYRAFREWSGETPRQFRARRSGA
jgi:AraC-like DNA-binding protein